MTEIKHFADYSGAAYFICSDCGAHVYSYAKANLEPRCMVCQFIVDQPSLSEDIRDQLRHRGM